MEDHTIVVTGANGNVGAPLVDALAAANDTYDSLTSTLADYWQDASAYVIGPDYVKSDDREVRDGRSRGGRG